MEQKKLRKKILKLKKISEKLKAESLSILVRNKESQKLKALLEKLETEN